VLVYDSDGRFDRVVPVKSDADKGDGVDMNGSGSVGKIRITTGKSVEAVTHWTLLGSSVRSFILHRYPHIRWTCAYISFSLLFLLYIVEGTNLVDKP